MKEYIISEQEAGGRLDKYLFKIFDKAAGSFVYKMLRKKNIVLNGSKADGTEKLLCGDTVKIFVSDDTFELFSSTKGLIGTENNKADTVRKKTEWPKEFAEIKVVYENDDIIGLNKPAGVLSQKAEKDDVSANEWLLEYLGYDARKSTFKPSVCNRLDRNTSGLLLCSKSLKGAQILSDGLKNRTIGKYYRCIVEGRVNSGAHLIGYLYKDEKTNKVTVIKEKEYEALNEKDKKSYSRIETAFEPVAVSDGMSYLEIELITGKTHQIRAHLASIGHPILGDGKYGHKKGYNRQQLHAYRAVFEEKYDIPEIKASLPADFKEILRCQLGIQED